MSGCPSVSAERYFADQDMPEECPICGDPNADETSGVPLFSEDPAFCSEACREVYVKEQKNHDALHVTDFDETDRLIAAHNAQCPKCTNSKKYCCHQGG
jgi:predicted nucleic acid-binding Zn ribbon protein